MTPERLKWTPELVARFWDGFAQTQLVQFSFSRQAGRSLLIAIDHLLPRNGVTLDFGAGDGNLVQLLCERGFQAAAYEPSEGRIDNLERTLAGAERFRGVVGQNTTRTFDLVIMAEVIEHVLEEQMDDVLRRLAGLTKPGGLLVVTTPNDENLELGMAYCPVSNLLFHRWQHVRSFTGETLAELLGRYGFEQVTTHKLGFDPSIYLPWDPATRIAADASKAGSDIPDYIGKLWRNEPARIGSESNLMYIGRRL
jgi:2-polyprenyl-3-methyl-5-hydroxy-6-metoxy-1,4-benzoquinol methylase